jgi:succinate-acetate transporter protein
MTTPAHAASPVFAEPTPVGLFGLAIGCAALLPMAFGRSLTPDGFEMAAMFCLLFGAGGQMLAGLMSLANKNLMGGTLFTTFAFNWIMNWWVLHRLAQGKLPDNNVVLAVDVVFLIIFVVLSYGFGFHSKLLFLFLLDIDLLYLFRILRELLHSPSLGLGIGVCTVALIAISLYLAFAILINPAAGRAVFKVPGPLFTAATPEN